MSGTVYCASRRTRGAMKKISAMPTHAPADCHSARDPDTIAEPGAAEQAARANPGREQREHEHVRRQRPAGDQEVVAAPALAFLRLCHTPTAASTAR